MLPLFKGKGIKANNRDYYRGISLFLTICKIYEMMILVTGKSVTMLCHFQDFQAESSPVLSEVAYAIDPIVQRREGLRSNAEKLAPALLS